MTEQVAQSAVEAPAKAKQNNVLVVAASSVGTVFEWYDFYLYGALASVITKQFFSGVNETTGYLLALLAFAAGFAVRPLGALVFGRLGDLWGRKNTFLITMLLMGLSTFGVGLLPSFDTIGVAAPLILVGLRLIQGLALGGEYGGAATYVAEHAPNNRRGLYTSWIQTTATAGLFFSLIVILGVRSTIGEDAFQAWGWRVPFLVSMALLAVSLWIRLKLNESPAFEKMREEGTGSTKPLADSFGNWANLKIVLLALLGLTAGQAVVWYTGQFYALFFLEKMLKVDGAAANGMVALSLLLATPSFVLFGWLSDKIGRKPIVMAGCVLAAATFFPLFHALGDAANPALSHAQAKAPVVVIADPADCSFQFDPIGKTVFNRSCDVAKSYLARSGVPYENQPGVKGGIAVLKIGAAELPSFKGEGLDKAAFAQAKSAWEAKAAAALKAAGYPAKADPAQVNRPLVIAILTLLVVYVAMVYGPIAAYLVELFPTRIRYTSMSLPYHLGNGWLGGFLPTTAFAIVATTGNIYSGLWYPVIVAGFTAVVGILFLKDTKGVSLDD